MEFSGSDIISKMDMCRLRVQPILDRILKQTDVQLDNTRYDTLISGLLSELPLPQLMVLSDLNINYQIRELIENEALSYIIDSGKPIEKKRISKYDIRHKETLRIFLKEYFELFFSDLAPKIHFETAEFKDKELIALFGDTHNPEQLKIADMLVMVQMTIDDQIQWVLIHWEHQGSKQDEFAKRMFHLSCGIYYQFQKIVFPIAMFTDDAKWRIPIEKTFQLSLGDYPITKFSYQLIKLKHMESDDFEQQAPGNPLTWAYLPLTHYPKEQRIEIKAKAVNGIAKTAQTEKGKATLVSLVDHSLKLSPEEEKQYNELIEKDLQYEEANMLQSIEELGIEKGLEQGLEKGLIQGTENLVKKMIDSGVLTMDQIVRSTGIGMDYIQKILSPQKIAL
ncbi:hypothetical protein MHK_010083 [Candidatus Magnetomorum sp. HK-1]|nr:hypothetical protein MHK_010083 [Candidatus Magnetomorum sp. HK-1]